MWITQTSIKQPVFATMVMCALLVMGMFSYNRLRVERMPEVTYPIVFISVQYPGASPEAVENDITRPIEEVVNTVNGVRLIRSNTYEGRSETGVELRLDANVERAVQDVRDKIALIRPGFPREAKDPLVLRGDFDNAQPVVSLAVTSKTRSMRELSTLTDQIIVKRFQNVPGVGQVQVSGSVVRQVLVNLRPAQMLSQGVGVDEVIKGIQSANMDIPAGRVTRGETEELVRVEGRMKEPAAFARIIVARRARGPVYLGDVADVEDGEKEAESYSRINGQPGLSINILKVQDANIVDVGNGIKAAAEDLKKVLPPDVELRVIYADVDFIQKALAGVKETIVEGAILTIFIVFMFLHSWRSTVITGLTLPISVIATFVAVYAFGFTLNFLTLMALSLCIGLLIDDAIVVRENIVRHLGMGKDHHRAAREGTEEIGLAVMATTFAIVAVFVPVAFMRGIIGKFFFQFGITVAVAVLVSLFVSFTLDPMLSSIWRDPAEGRFRRFPWLERVMGQRRGRHRLAARGLRRAPRMGARQPRQGGRDRARGVLLELPAGPAGGHRVRARHRRGRTSFRLNAPVGSSLEYTDAKARQVEALLRTYPEVEMMVANVGHRRRAQLRARRRAPRRTGTW